MSAPAAGSWSSLDLSLFRTVITFHYLVLYIVNGKLYGDKKKFKFTCIMVKPYIVNGKNCTETKKNRSHMHHGQII
jgi:hypothetical protein